MTTKKLNILAFLIIITLQTFTASAARVINPYTHIYEGIEYATGTDTSPRSMKAYVLRIDLQNPNVQLYASPDNGAAPKEVTTEKVGTFIANHNCKVAVNASYCDSTSSTTTPADVDIWGLGISDGTVVSSGYTSRGLQYNCQMRFTADKAASIVQSMSTPSGFHTAVTGNAYHLVNGTALGATTNPTARTSFGLSSDGRFLIMCCVNGSGATILEMSYWMLDFGAWNAINMDGGGSTCMARADIGNVNVPVSSERLVGVHLGVRSVAYNPNPPYTFSFDNQDWTLGNGCSSPLYWTDDLGWPGVIYWDQIGDDCYIYSPVTDFVGAAGDAITVRVYPQYGNSASHDMQLFWRTTEEPNWDAAKSSPIVNYSAQNAWATITMDVDNAKWVGKHILQMRLDVDNTNKATQWVIDSVMRTTPPPSPTAVSANPTTIHPGECSQLSATVGSGNTLEWFTGSCGGTAVPGGDSPTVCPTATTTYYVRAKDPSTLSVSDCVPVSVTLRPYGVRISDLDHSPAAPNPVKVWGKVTSTSPVKLSDGQAEITLSGVTASVGEYLMVVGNWNGDVLAVNGPINRF